MTTVEYELQPPTERPAVTYSTAAPVYLRYGHKPIPASGKTLLVSGATGNTGVVTERKVKEEWIPEFPWANTAIRLEGCIGIDVDDYGQKNGAKQLAELETKFGKLPQTFSSTSRGQGATSRILFYQVPQGVRFQSDPTADIEIIQERHRYAVVAPSVHPLTGREYIWYNPEGSPSSFLPKIEDFALLPQAWIDGLRKESREQELGREIFEGDLATWESWLNDDEPTPPTQALIESINSKSHIGHAELLDYMLEIHKHRKDFFERGVAKALAALREKYFTTTNESNSTKEWTDAARWVVGKEWEPTPIDSMTITELAQKIFGSDKDNDEKSFWKSRPILSAIYKLARQKTVAPWTLFGLIIQRVLHSVPWEVPYTTYKGPAALNTLVALVGRTGTGKSTSLDILDLNVVFNDSDPEHQFSNTWQGVIEPGSGEAMPDHYMTTQKDENKKIVKVWAHPNRAAMFGFDEVGMLEGRQSREGSTITEYMKQGCSGTGFGRVLKGGGGTMLPPRSYRFSLFINVQPARAGLLFTPNAIAGGLPSRFLFFNTHDKKMRAEQDFSECKKIVLPRIDWTHVKEIRALPVMDEKHRNEQFEANEGKVDEIDSHLLLTRAKVTVALALLDGRTELIQEDWELSEIVIRHSLDTRKSVLDALAKVANQELARQGRAAGTKAVIAEEVTINRNVRNAARGILRHRASGLADSQIRKKLAHRVRGFFDEALDFLAENPNWTGED